MIAPRPEGNVGCPVGSVVPIVVLAPEPPPPAALPAAPPVLDVLTVFPAAPDVVVVVAEAPPAALLVLVPVDPPAPVGPVVLLPLPPWPVEVPGGATSPIFAVQSTPANTNPPADGVNVSPSAVATAKRITASAGKIHDDFGIGPCALMLISSNPATRSVKP